MPAALDHALALALLARRQFIAPTRKRVLAGSKLQANRRPPQPKLTPESIHQIASVSGGERCRLVAMNNDGRRITPTLMGIAQFDSPPSNQRWLMGLRGLGKDTVKLRCRQGFVGSTVDLRNLFKKAANARAMQRRDKPWPSKIEKPEFYVKLPAFGNLPFLLLNPELSP